MAIINSTEGINSTDGTTIPNIGFQTGNNLTTLTKNMEDFLLLMDKIQKAKQMFLAANIKKTGRNNYQKYDYFTLDDIVPTVLKICETFGLAVKFDFGEQYGDLTVYDLETGASTHWTTPLPPYEPGRDASKNIQSIQTYARRALYLQFLEIVEPNVLEMEKSSPKKPKQQHNKEKVVTPADIDSLAQHIHDHLLFNGININKATMIAEARNRENKGKITKQTLNRVIEKINSTTLPEK